MKWNLYFKTYKNPLLTYFKSIHKNLFYKCKFLLFYRIVKNIYILRKHKKFRFSKHYNIQKKKKASKYFIIRSWILKCNRNFYSLKLNYRYYNIWSKYNFIFYNLFFYRILTNKLLALESSYKKNV